MTHLEREYLVERYMAGDMSAAEEGNFFIHVAVDDELQQMLKAHRLMYGAIRSDSDTAVPETAPYRSHILGMLAASHTAVGDGAAAQIGADGASVGGALATEAAGGSGGFLAGLGLTKTIVAALTGISIVVGTVAVILPGNSEHSVDRSTPTQTVTPSVDAAVRSATPTVSPLGGDRVESVQSKQTQSAPSQERVEPRAESGSVRSQRATVSQSVRQEKSETAVNQSDGGLYGGPVVSLPSKDSVNPIQIETTPSMTTPVKRK